MIKAIILQTLMTNISSFKLKKRLQIGVFFVELVTLYWNKGHRF